MPAAYGMAPNGGPAAGYLAICDPREQRTGELAEALLAIRRAIAVAGQILTLSS